MIARRVLGELLRLARDQRGGVSAVLVLMMIPIIGALSMGAEASSWFLVQRAMQNAADSSAMAAATNACSAVDDCYTKDKSATFQQEAASVANQMGFLTNTSTTVAAAKVTCPDASADCYQVTITRKIPVYLTRIVGFNGDTTLDGAAAQTLVARAIVKRNATANTYCLLALGIGESLHANGTPFADMSGCKLATNGSARCTGGGLQADVVDAVGTADGCAADTGIENEGIDTIADPYEHLKTNIPSTGCTTYAAETIPAGPLVIGATPKVYCGSVTLGGNVDVSTGPGGGVLIIDSGSLIVPGGMTLKTIGDSGLTVIFVNTPTMTGVPPANLFILDGGGTMDIAAPKAGSGSVWEGVAVYQHPDLPEAKTDVKYSGNSPTWNITGLIYMPDADLEFRGVVNKASNGHNCFAMVVNSFDVRGTGTLVEQQTECRQAGLPPPEGQELVRQALVQ